MNTETPVIPPEPSTETPKERGPATLVEAKVDPRKHFRPGKLIAINGVAFRVKYTNAKTITLEAIGLAR